MRPQLSTAVGNQIKGARHEVDMLNWVARTALELIGQGGLGYSFDPLTKDVHNEFGDALKRHLCVILIFCVLLLYA